MIRTLARLCGSLVLGFAVAACSSAASPGPTMMASDMPIDSGMPLGSGDMQDEAGTLGEPGDATNADRTIHFTASDLLVFDPDAVEVKVGETVTFEIENIGTVAHEFIVGSPERQAEHESEMQTGQMAMDEPNAIVVPVGKTVSLTWHFTEAGTTQFGCHEPGHFPAGMVGTITVSG